MNAPIVATSVGDLTPAQARPTLLAYFIPGNLVAAGTWYAAGSLTWSHVVVGLVGGVAAVGGVVLGARLRRFITMRVYTAAVVVLCVGAALNALLG